MLDPTRTVASIVLDHSECASIFQKHRIDYCCRGDLSIAAACERAGLDTAALIEELSHAVSRRTGQRAADPRELSSEALISYIVSTHHEYLRKTLPFLQTLAAKVSRVHGDREPQLRELDAMVRELSETLLPHLDAEEQSLFPRFLGSAPHAEDLASEARSMLEEHRAVGELLEKVRRTTNDFEAPDFACNSYRTLFAELEQLEGDTLRHVHLENHVLWPRLAPERGLRT